MNQEEKISRYHYLLFAICFLGTAFGGVVSTLMSVYLPVAVKDLLGNQETDQLNNISAYINAVFILGGAAGGFIAGIISDKAGRKKAVIFSIAVLGIFTLLTGYMPGWRAVVFCRLMSGFGLGAILVTTTTIMMEEWPRKSRAIFMGILSISIPVGIFSAGVTDYFVSSWRQAFTMGLLPLVLAAAAVWLLKESADWQNNRKGTAEHPAGTSIFAAPHYQSWYNGRRICSKLRLPAAA